MTLDLSSSYLGLPLKNPLVASSCPLTGDIEMLRSLEAAGASCVVLPSIFEDQIGQEGQEVNQVFEFGSECFYEALDHFPLLDDYNTGVDSYLALIRQAKKDLSIPVIASLNGSTPGGWLQFAKAIEEAGSDALELNVHFVASDASTTGSDVEERYLELVRSLRSEIRIPIAVKVGPYFSAFANMAEQLVKAGADGIVLFNRYPQPDIDLRSLQVNPHLDLSTSSESRLPLRWIALLEGKIEASLAATTGIHTWRDLVKMLLVGADVGMIASAYISRGPEVFTTLLSQLRNWLEEGGYHSVEQVKGSMSQRNCPDPARFERANYMKAITQHGQRP